MEAPDKGQVSGNAAEVYEEFFLPALFNAWVGPVSDAAAVSAGQHVLDVACGTGVLTREAHKQVGSGGRAVGLDRNEGMLAVARRAAPSIEWKLGQAESLPFETGSFDAVMSQFGLMFFEDRPAALKEMWRVLRPGGRVAVAVWDALDHAPGYAAMVGLLHRLFGEAEADVLRAPYNLGDAELLLSLFTESGMENVQIMARDGTAKFPSIEAWVRTDVKGWSLADMIDDARYATLQRAAQAELKAFVRPDGSVIFPHPALIVTAMKA